MLEVTEDRGKTGEAIRAGGVQLTTVNSETIVLESKGKNTLANACGFEVLLSSICNCLRGNNKGVDSRVLDMFQEVTGNRYRVHVRARVKVSEKGDLVIIERDLETSPCEIKKVRGALQASPVINQKIEEIMRVVAEFFCCVIAYYIHTNTEFSKCAFQMTGKKRLALCDV